MGWYGELAYDRKQAEANVAGAALAEIMADPEMNYIVTQVTGTSSWKGGAGKGGMYQQATKLTSAAPKTYLCIGLDEGGATCKEIGSVEIGPATTLSSVRVLINQS